MLALYLGISGFSLWLITALLPWRPWSTREQLDAVSTSKCDLSDITVLIPARNEAAVILTTLNSLAEQDKNLSVIIIDDESTDNTRDIIQQSGLKNQRVISGQPTQPGWSGKLSALEQGRQFIQTKYTLLLDADIALKPGTLVALKTKMGAENLAMLSLMANLRMETFWEKLLMPAFIYFFKLLYPFHLSNSKSPWVATAAGGCILIKTNTLNEIGGFSAIKDALIDDCSLARVVKDQGHKIWTGLTHSAVSLRSYTDLGSIWLMVTRTAFTQLHYSYILLLVCILLMTLAYLIPIIGLFSTVSTIQMLSLATLLIMFALYLPTLRYYRIHPLWCISMPLAGIIFLLMTCHSAIKHSFGSGAEWKGRKYIKNN